MQAIASTTIGSFLDNPQIDGAPVVSFIDNELVVSDDTRRLGRMEDIEANFSTFSLGAYVACFFSKKKDFGWSLAGRHTDVISNSSNSFFDTNYSLLSGPIYRKIEKNETKLSFGIDIGFDNRSYNGKGGNNFLARVRVGLTFNVFDKANKK